ncbi:MAG: hypothetical protein KAS90_00990 [Candidatus Aenigmarchaeota archaeon]|nr:hypothetical protein [Candidatus Aenigmarchaeota archaeon]
MSISESELNMGGLITVIRNIYVLSFLEHYNTKKSTVNVGSIYTDRGIPLFLTRNNNNILHNLNNSSSKSKNKKEISINLKSYRKNIPEYFDEFESFLSYLNTNDSLSEKTAFKYFHNAFAKHSIDFRSGKTKDLDILKMMINTYRDSMKKECQDIFGHIKSDVDSFTDQLFSLDEGLNDLDTDNPVEIKICSNTEYNANDILCRIDYSNNSKYSLRLLIEQKGTEEADLLLASGVLMKYMELLDIPISESNQKRIYRYITNANFLKGHLDHINRYMGIVKGITPTSSKQEQVPVLI